MKAEDKKQFQGRRSSQKLSELVLHPDLQSRAGGLDPDHADDLATALRNKKRLPPVRIRTVSGMGHVITDGFHTVEAHRLVGRTQVTCVAHPGTWEDAVLDAASANQQHLGLKRTNADKRRAVQMVLLVVPQWANNRIAGHVGVSDKTVAEERDRLESTSEIPKLSEREGADGRTRGPHREPKPAPDTPHNSVGGIQSDDWRDFPLVEFLEADDRVWKVLHSSRIWTAGHLDKYLAENDTSALTASDVAALRSQIRKLSDPQPQVHASVAVEPPHPFAELKALATRFSRAVTTAMKGEGEAAKRLHDYLSCNGLVDHPAGEVIDPSRIENDGREESALSLIALRGIRKLIALAGQTGRRKTESEIKAIYDAASGGWVPPAVLRRRRMKK